MGLFSYIPTSCQNRQLCLRITLGRRKHTPLFSSLLFSYFSVLFESLVFPVSIYLMLGRSRASWKQFFASSVYCFKRSWHDSQGLTMAMEELQTFHTCEFFDLCLSWCSLYRKIQHALIIKKHLCYLANLLFKIFNGGFWKRRERSKPSIQLQCKSFWYKIQIIL